MDVNNQENTGKESDSLRICHHCLDMLECRRRVQIEQMMQPIICQLYNHLQKIKLQAQNSVDLYLKMYNSLTSGETTFQLQDTQSLRTTIAKQAEMIDTLSKKIAALPDEHDNPKVQTLQNAIKRATSHYIKEYLLTLPVPPSLEELEQIKRLRLLRNDEDEVEPETSIKKVTVTTGWSPSNMASSVKTDSHTEDPLIEQINIVRNYIEQARKAQRFEEVASLETNLKFLKQAYREQELLKQQS